MTKFNLAETSCIHVSSLQSWRFGAGWELGGGNACRHATEKKITPH